MWFLQTEFRKAMASALQTGKWVLIIVIAMNLAVCVSQNIFLSFEAHFGVLALISYAVMFGVGWLASLWVWSLALISKKTRA